MKERLIKELTDFLVKKNKNLDVNLFCNAHELAEEFGNTFLPENKKNSLCQIYDERNKCADYRTVSNSCVGCNFFKDPFTK